MKDLSRDFELGLKVLKHTCAKQFCKGVFYLHTARNMLDCHSLYNNSFSNKMDVQLNVFCIAWRIRLCDKRIALRL